MSFTDFNLFLDHVKLYHTLSFIIECPVLNCNRKYESKMSLRNHFKTHNKDIITTPRTQIIEDSPIVTEASLDSSELIDIDPTDEILRLLNIDTTKFVLSLMANEKLTRKQAILIANEAHKQKAKLLLSMQSLENNGLSPLNNIYEHFKQPSIVETEFKFRKYLQDLGLLTKIKTVTISLQSEHKFVSGIMKIVEDKRVIQLMDIKQILFKFFNTENVMNEIYTHIQSLLQSDFETISNIIQTPFWNNIKKVMIKTYYICH